MQIIHPLILFFIAIIVIFEIITVIIYGKFVSNEITNVYINLDETKLRLNTFNSSMLMTPCYIARHPFSLFSKYHIEGLGTVPRWSKLHKKIEYYFAITIKNNQ